MPDATTRGTGACGGRIANADPKTRTSMEVRDLLLRNRVRSYH
jgi:hypothetical protein